MKILNLNEGFFPIKLDFEENELNIPNIGDLTSSLKVNLEISKAFPLSNKVSALISLASFISDGPGAVTILYSLPNLFKISLMRSL